MKKIMPLIFGIVILIGISSAQTFDTYIWEAHRSTGIGSAADPLVSVLRQEVDSILTHPKLRALRSYHTDQEGISYYTYAEPGRIITTLGLAYPYLTTAEQAQARTYVQNECSDANYTPWSSSASLPTDRGSWRNTSLITAMHTWSFYWGMDGQKRPRVHTLYGLWAYTYNSQDTSILRANWNAVKTFYINHSSEGNLYGTFCGHIAMARLAQMMGDNTTMNTVVTNARTAFTDGLTFANVKGRADTYFGLVGYDYGGGSGRGIIHDAFYLLNITPEVGRYVKEAGVALHDSVIAKNNSGKTKFPFWWLLKSPYFTVWAGEEGIGLVPEIIGMIFPIERWVAGDSKETLRGFQIHRAMYGIGDCYALEAIINTINAYGTESWGDVRTTGPVENPVEISKPGEMTENIIINPVSISPIHGGLLMTVSANQHQVFSCLIADLSGRIVFKDDNLSVSRNINGHEIRLAPGTYLWSVAGRTRTESTKRSGLISILR
jgi:hypothetical protein